MTMVLVMVCNLVMSLVVTKDFHAACGWSCATLLAVGAYRR